MYRVIAVTDLQGTTHLVSDGITNMETTCGTHILDWKVFSPDGKIGLAEDMAITCKECLKAR